MPWPTKKLGEIAEVIMGQSPPSSSYNERGEGLPFFQGKAEFGEIHPTPVKYCSSPSRIAEANDVLISVRAPVGNINIAREKSCVGRGLGALRAKKNILNQMFLFYFMKKSENNWSRLSTGSTFSAIKGSSLKNFEIPLPPLTTQKQIVERLDKIAEAQKLNDELIQKSDELFQSLLHQELNPIGKDWGAKKLVELVDFLDNQRKPISDAERQKRIGPYPYYGANGQVGWIDDYLFDEDLVLLAEDGGYFGSKNRPIAYRISGKTWVNNHAHVLRAKIGIAETNFIYYRLMFYDVKPYITGSTRTKLNKSAAEKIKISIPPLATQKQIVAKLSAVQDYKKQLLEQKSKLKELFDSALAKSMKN